MSTPPPIYFSWDGHALLPLDRFSRLAEQSFTSGHAYRMIVDEERSTASHRQYFAAIREAWANLPEPLAAQFLTPDHLRKWALVRTGFCNKQIWSVPSRAEAVRTAAALRQVDEFSVVVNDKTTITRLTAKSQAYSKMGRREFQQSKEAVLDYLAKLIDTTPDELLKAGRAAA